MTTFFLFSHLLFLILLKISTSSKPPSTPSLSASEWMEGILAPLGHPSNQEMECLASDNPLDPAAELVQVLFKRTWPRNLVPYMLDYSLLPLDRLVIAKAMHIIQSISCVRQVCSLPREQARPVAKHLKELCLHPS